MTDGEFEELWNRYKSVSAIAKATGMNQRTIGRRRRRIEEKLGLDLDANKMVVARHEARVYHEFDNGIVIVFSDAHFWPGFDTTAYRALLKFVDQMRPNVVVCNGDAFDGASISRHPPIGWDSLPTVKEELDAVEDHLGRIEQISKGKLIWTLGNHDSRYETRLAMIAPEFRGIEKFHLKDHFQRWVPCWSAWINDVVFKHRFKGGVHAAFNNTLWAGKSIVTGHDHQLWSRAFRDYNGIRWGIDTGTLADVYGPQFTDYTEDNPRIWNSGFYVLTFSKGRLLSSEQVIVTDENTVEFRGQTLEI